jgi:hypothetical protein
METAKGVGKEKWNITSHAAKSAVCHVMSRIAVIVPGVAIISTKPQ